jgi:hypothetical protein
MRNKFLLVIVTFWVSFISCKDAQTNTASDENTIHIENYFSIKQFMDDQWELYKDDVYVLMRTIQYKNQSDTAYVDLDEKNFKDIRAYFDPIDISSKTFLNLYHVEEIYDSSQEMYIINYLANNDELLLQKLSLVIHDETLKIMSIYAETQSKNIFKTKTSKLNYNPKTSIVIQENEKPLIGDAKHTITHYFFEY